MTKYKSTLREHFTSYDYPVFTLTDMRVFLSGSGISSTYMKVLTSSLIRKKEIVRISKGVYTFHKDIAVVGFAYRPFYYGLEDALSYRNFWTQSANPMVLTTGSFREGIRTFLGNNYTVKRIRPDLFFGFEFIRYYDLWLPVSDPEKTLLDLIYYNHDIRGDAAERLLESINIERLNEYMRHYSLRVRKRAAEIAGPLHTDAMALRA